MQQMKTMSIKVAIVDDHPLAIQGVQSMLLPYNSYIKIIAEYMSGSALLEGLKQTEPDVLLLDIMLPDINGKELATIISETWPDIAILALTSLDAPSHVKGMMRRGCRGYLLKDTDQATLVHAIEQVYAGNEFIESSLRDQMLQNMLKQRKQYSDVPELTPREKEILQLIVQENTNQEIAEKLFISQRTVEMHRFSLSHKLDVKNLVGLIKVAIQMGFVE